MSDANPGIFSFGAEHAQTYEGKCQCGENIAVSTQKGEAAEYYTEVHVRCQKCGGSVEFFLPVN